MNYKDSELSVNDSLSWEVNNGVNEHRKRFVLLITNNLYPNTNANSEIAYKIAKYLQCHNCDVTMLGLGDMNDILQNSCSKMTCGLKTEYVKSLYGYYYFLKVMRLEKNRAKGLIKVLFKPHAFFAYLRLRKNGYDVMVERAYQKDIIRLLKQVHYDCILGFMEPRAIPKALVHCNPRPPFLIYQLDPWATHFWNPEWEVVRKEEGDAYEKAKHVFVTDLIYNECKKYYGASIMSKVSVLNFPNIVEISSKDIFSWDKEKIHCVFAGRFYNKIRDPKYVIELFRKLNDSNIVFHIVGAEREDGIIPQDLPENIICHGRVSGDIAMKYMQSADVLVNVGNTVLNQMPSKILTYISFGKPVLNIVKSEKCPTLSYMEKYPLALNLMETSDLYEEDVRKVSDFLLKTKGESISFEEIEHIYENCTPEYVGKQVYDIICKVVDETKGNKQDYGTDTSI